MSDDVYDEIVEEFYGLDPVSLKVDNVAITRSGRISRWTNDKGYVIHQLAGNDRHAEIVSLFGLTDLVQVDPRTTHIKRRAVIDALHATALSRTIPTDRP
jgi:hypothetical protein